MNKNIFSIFSAALIAAAALTSCNGLNLNQGSALPTFEKLNWDQVEELEFDAVILGPKVKMRKPAEKAIEGLVSAKVQVYSGRLIMEISSDGIPSTIVGGISGNDLKTIGGVTAGISYSGRGMGMNSKTISATVDKLGNFSLETSVDNGSFWLNISATIRGRTVSLPVRPLLMLESGWHAGNKGESNIEIVREATTISPTVYGPAPTPAPSDD